MLTNLAAARESAVRLPFADVPCCLVPGLAAGTGTSRNRSERWRSAVSKSSEPSNKVPRVPAQWYQLVGLDPADEAASHAGGSTD